MRVLAERKPVGDKGDFRYFWAVIGAARQQLHFTGNSICVLS